MSDVKYVENLGGKNFTNGPVAMATSVAEPYWNSVNSIEWPILSAGFFSPRGNGWKHLNSKIKWYDPVLTETNYKNTLQYRIVSVIFFVSVIKNIEEVLKLFHNVITM